MMSVDRRSNRPRSVSNPGQDDTVEEHANFDNLLGPLTTPPPTPSSLSTCMPRRRGRRGRRSRRTFKIGHKSVVLNSPARQRSSSLSQTEWLNESPVLEIAYSLARQRKVSTRELARIVASDRLWHTGKRTNSPITIRIPASVAAASAAAHRRRSRKKRKSRYRRAAVNTLSRRGDLQTFDIPGDEEVDVEVCDEDFGLVGDICDPLSLEPLGSFTYQFRKHQVYNVDTLFEYIVSSGSFQDPTTRLEYTNSELDQIEAVYREAGGDHPMSLVEFKSQNAKAFEEEKIKASAVDGVENILDDIVADLRDTVSGVPMHRVSSRQLYLATQLFPRFDHTLAQLSSLCPNTALRCLSIYASQIKGPPQRPAKDPYKLMKGVLAHLKSSREALETTIKESHPETRASIGNILGSNDSAQTSTF